MQSPKKKKILFLMQLPPPVHGAAVMNKSIRESELINTSFDCRYVNISTAKDINDIGKGGLRKWFKSLGLLIRVKMYLLFFHPNLVYITLSPVGMAFYKDSFFILVSKLFGKKITIHLHGKGIEKAMNTRFSNWYYNFVFKGTVVIHLSDILVSDLNKISTIKDIHILNNGIMDNAIPKIDHKGINIVYLSNMVESKGAFILLKAAKILHDNGLKDFQVHFAGQWYEPEFKKVFLEYFESNSMSEYCQYHGPLYNREKQEFLAKADVFVLPTRYPNECFPLVILEAMSYGLPIIATDEGAIPELVVKDFNGIVIDKNDPGDWAIKIASMINDKDIQIGNSDNSRQIFLNSYTFNTFINNLSDILLNK